MDLEALERVARDDTARELVLRLARLSEENRLGDFIVELSASDDIDADTKELCTELACDRDFLLALDDYVHRTSLIH
ncbi:MAG: hypothetical protein JO064_08820 [Actinobacteria bacterium]|nr:hypothetical protein [Actinomycetota bacterium]